MKLIHVFSAPQSAYFFMNGQLDYMISKGMDVTVVMPFDIEFNNKFKIKQPNVKVINVNFERNISVKVDLKCLFKLITVFRKVKPDIIHLHTPKASLLGALAARFLLKKNIIYQMHGLVSASGNDVQKGLLYSMEKLTCSLSNHIFAVSESLKEFAVEHKFCKQNKISVIENGTINGINFHEQFNPENIQRTNSVLNKLATEKFVIGFMGRLVKDKGIEDYLKILSKCKENQLSTVGVVIGPDESKGDFSVLLKKQNLIVNEDIIVLGQQLEPQNFMIYFDVLLLPTKREGFGLVGAESNALKIPVVGYDIPGFRDAVKNNETGLLVKFEDTHELFNAIIKYYKSPDLKRQHGNNGRKRVIRDFKSEHIWQALLLEYRLLVDKKGFEV
jgi:glycosyltransferase involved in cell wall biosynthesis